MKKRKQFKLNRFIVILPVIVIAVLLLFLINKLSGPKQCSALTPLSLQRFWLTTGVKPIYGEKCDLAKKQFVIRLMYENSQQAEQAEYGLEISTEGEKQAGGITFEGNTVGFFREEEKLAIVVFLDKEDEDEVEKALEEINPERLFKNFKVPTRGDATQLKDEFFPEGELEEKAEEKKEEWKEGAIEYKPKKSSPSPKPKPTSTPVQKSQSDEEGIWEAVYDYAPSIDMETPSIDFKLDKIVGNYALVQVIPVGVEAEGAALVLEKVNGRWVVQAFGTIFPEWQEKVPELFQW